jgi:hypothetical protein
MKTLSDQIENATHQNSEAIIKEIAEIGCETEREIYIKQLAKKLGVRKSAVQGDIRRLMGSSQSTDDKTVYSANFSGLVDIVNDESGNVSYLVMDEHTLLIESVYEVDGVLYSPPGKEHLPFQLPKANEVISWYESDNDQDLVESILSYLKRFSYLPEKQWLIVAYSVLLSYIQDHPDIDYLPMLLFYAVPERGKSRTGKAVTYISYRGIHVVDLREASLFRFSENLKATLFFDMMNIWKKAEKNGSEDILLGRYEKGAKTPRVICPDKGAFRDTTYYDIYGPTYIATNQPVHKILDTRCIFITMPNKPGDYENPSAGKAQILKERLTAFRARTIAKPLPELQIIEGLNGRLWDIAKPLLQICKVAHPRGFELLLEALLEIAGQRIEDKKESIEGEILEELDDLSPTDVIEWTIPTQELLEKINSNRPSQYMLSSQGLGKKLKAMGIKTRKVRGYSEIKIMRSEFQLLKAQYGLLEMSLDTFAETLPNSTTLKNLEISTTYDGREFVDNAEHPIQTLPENNHKNQLDRRLVGSGRELGNEDQQKISLNSLEIIKDV